MTKTGFRGERKGILTPFTYSPIRRLLPRRGECSDGNSDGKGECSGGDYIGCGFTF